MTPPDPSGNGGSGRGTKVARNIRSYGLDGLGERLERLWTGDADERRSLRDLAALFNHRLLERAMDDAGMDPLPGEVENVYRLLTDDDVSSGRRTEVRRRLEGGGVDVDRLQRDFVSHQAIHTYLTTDREASYPADERSPGDREQAKLTRLRQRVSAVSTDAISRLDAADHVDVGEFDVFVDVTVLCRDCGASYDFDAFLENGGCDCEP